MSKVVKAEPAEIRVFANSSPAHCESVGALAFGVLGKIALAFEFA